MFKKFLAMGGVAFLVGCASVNEEPVAIPQGFIDAISTEPFQDAIHPVRTEINGYKVLEKFRYKIGARVLSTKSYAGERAGDVMTDDFLLAWNAAALPKYTIGLTANQHDRFGYWDIPSNSGLGGSEVQDFIANTHIVPTNEEIKKLVGEVRQDDYVYLEGYLLNIYDKDGSGRYWSSSVSRTDAGGGACEIMLVEKIVRLPRSYSLLKVLNQEIVLSPIQVDSVSRTSLRRKI